jgi:hypothetical protein
MSDLPTEPNVTKTVQEAIQALTPSLVHGIVEVLEQQKMALVPQKPLNKKNLEAMIKEILEDLGVMELVRFYKLHHQLPPLAPPQVSALNAFSPGATSSLPSWFSFPAMGQPTPGASPPWYPLAPTPPSSDTVVAPPVRSTLPTTLQPDRPTNPALEPLPTLRRSYPVAVLPPLEAAQYTTYVWQDKPHLYPEDFEFPDGSVQLAWQEWCCGNSAKGYPPLRYLSSNDLSTRNKKKLLSDYRFLMVMMEEELKRQNQWIGHASLDQANTMYQLAMDIFKSEDALGRKRSFNDVKWGTMKCIIRKRRRLARAHGSEGLEE